ncbi:MAG: succinyldiaminopimelate transaminase [Betaproteobacteria bacterium]|nr:succinyldiaminopimelate transaminase [Betaproteobacteria bacterium]
MNPRLEQLQPYPFQKLRALFEGVQPAGKTALNLSIGEPKHATPDFIKNALVDHLGGLANYPLTAGSDALRGAIADWCARRYGVTLDPATQILPVNGSREALFAFAQAVVNPKKHVKRVVSPNPFYQIYEGAALLAGAVPYFLNTLPGDNFRLPLESVPEEVWADTHLIFVCSPGNPTGHVLNLDDWRAIFALADRYGCVIASDECYSEIYFDAPPLGALTAAQQLGRGTERLVVFNSLSKRSNVPGLRSGFVAGDAAILKNFLLYRTYHGCAMSPPVQAASAAAWNDEAHVEDNRRQYRAKFAAVMPMLQDVLDFKAPDASFYLWAQVPGADDAAFVRELYRQENVTLLPGSYLAREAGGVNPGAGFVRMALVEPLAACIEAAERIRHFIQTR